MTQLVFLHGFLGQPQDWQAVIQDLRLEQAPLCLDLNRLELTKLSLTEAGETIAREILKTPAKQLVLVGYSMGGRVLLECLPHLQARSARTVLVSTNLKLLSEEEKQQRLALDETWAEKFLSAPFDQVLREWNQQEVFQNSVSEPLRREEDYDRQVLADQQLNWSLATQENLLGKAQRANAVYVAGEKDLRYQRFISEWGPKSGLKITNAPQAGHRVLFDDPKFLAKLIQQLGGLQLKP